MTIANEQAKFDRFITGRDKQPDNDSGRGPESRLPNELRGMNWGALLLNFIWGLAMKTPWAWLCLVPFIGMVWPFVMMVRGNEWAWQYRKWDSVDHFRRVQEKWALWGLILIVVSIVLSILLMSWTQRMMSLFMTV
jgi:hypothetical protein